MSGWWGRYWSLVEVRDLLGHRSITTTERYARRARNLGLKLARAVLGSEAAHAVTLAHAVIAGGPHATAKALELARVVGGDRARALAGKAAAS